MSVNPIPINTGTGPKIAADLIATTNYQIVKIVQAGEGSTGSLSPVLSVTNTSTATVVVVGVQSGSSVNQSLVLTTSGGIQNIQTVAQVTTILGTVAVSGGGGGAQYTLNTTAMANTGTATLVMGMQTGGTTGRGLALTTSGQALVQVSTGTISVTTVATITTLLGTVAVSGGGGGVQYSRGDTSIAATGTGTIALGVQGTTAFAIAITSSGQQLVAVANTPTVTGTVGALFLQTLDASNDSIRISGVQTGTSGVYVGVAVSTTGGLYIASGGGGGSQYANASTGMGSTATGTIVMGMQTGATTGRAIAVTTSGNVLVGGSVTVSGTVGALFLQTLDGTNDSIRVMGLQTGSSIPVSIAVSTTGGLYIASGGGGGAQYSVGNTNMGSTATGNITLGMQTGATTGRAIALTTSGQQLVQVSTGTVNISGTVPVIQTAHASRFQAFVMATTSAAAGVIVVTSGAHTLYITDIMVSVVGPMTVGLYSETTGPGIQAHLATNGGFVNNLTVPFACFTNQSLRVILSSSGTCSVSVCGYTVT